MVQNVRLRNVSIVTDPIDPRCMIWPWQVNDEEKTIEACQIMTAFRLDDFLGKV
jgi:hypothetical protein